MLVADGRVHGLEDFRQRLAKEAPTEGTSMAESLLAAWRHWGPGFLNEVEGDFAIALWDKRDSVPVSFAIALGSSRPFMRRMAIALPCLGSPGAVAS